MALNCIVEFFEVQFRKQVSAHDFVLNPFEEAALPCAAAPPACASCRSRSRARAPRPVRRSGRAAAAGRRRSRGPGRSRRTPESPCAAPCECRTIWLEPPVLLLLVPRKLQGTRNRWPAQVSSRHVRHLPPVKRTHMKTAARVLDRVLSEPV